MSNPKFLGMDLSIPTFAWSEGADASYPISNLYTGYPDQISQSANWNSPQYLTADLGSAVACNALAIDNHNFTLVSVIGGSISLESADDAAFSVNLATRLNNIQTLISSGGAYLLSFASATAQYWRLKFTKSGHLGDIPFIGNFYLGVSLDFEKTQKYNFFTNMPEYQTSKQRAVDGRLRTSQLFNAIRRHKATFAYHSDSFITNWLTFLGTVRGSLRPFYYLDNEGNAYCVNFSADFNPYQKSNYNINDIEEFEMESTIAG